MNVYSVVLQYEDLIKELIPYACKGQLLENINKFSERIPAKYRQIIKREVERRIRPTKRSADNSGFASYPVRKCKHFGVHMKLDELGEKILMDEVERYNNQYTVGVLEVVMNEKNYHNILKVNQNKKNINTFKVPSKSLKDIDFGSTIAIQADGEDKVLVECEGKLIECELITIGQRYFKVRYKSKNVFKNNSRVRVMTHCDSFLKKSFTIDCTVDRTIFYNTTKLYESSLYFDKGGNNEFDALIKEYINSRKFSHALESELEKERFTQSVERDIVFASSPWVPIFLSDNVSDAKVLITKQSFKSNYALFNGNITLPRSVIERAVNECVSKSEAFIFMGSVKTKQGAKQIFTTLRDLLSQGLLESFIYRAKQTDSLKVLQVRLKQIDEDECQDVIEANGFHNFDQQFNRVLFVRDVTNTLSNDVDSEPTSLKAIPKSFAECGKGINFDCLVGRDVDRRKEPRFKLKRNVKIKYGLFSSLEAKVEDISPSGMKVKIRNSLPKDFPKVVRLSIPSINMHSIVYKVVSINDKTIRLCVTSKSRLKAHGIVNSLIRLNPDFFNKHNISHHRKLEFRVLWELAARNLPSVSVLCTKDVNPLKRLNVAYSQVVGRDAGLFRGDCDEIYLHGLFADKVIGAPRSRILTAFLSNEIKNALIVHCCFKKRRKVVSLTEEQFFSENRYQLELSAKSGKTNLFVNDLQCWKVHINHHPIVAEKLYWLSQVDEILHKKIEKSLSRYSHVITSTDVSLLHSGLLIKDMSQCDVEHKVAS